MNVLGKRSRVKFEKNNNGQQFNYESYLKIHNEFNNTYLDFKKYKENTKVLHFKNNPNYEMNKCSIIHDNKYKNIYFQPDGYDDEDILFDMFPMSKKDVEIKRPDKKI